VDQGATTMPSPITCNSSGLTEATIADRAMVITAAEGSGKRANGRQLK